MGGTAYNLLCHIQRGREGVREIDRERVRETESWKEERERGNERDGSQVPARKFWYRERA